MNSEIVFTIGATRLEGEALTTLQDELRFLAQPGRRLTLDLTAVESVGERATKVLLAASARCGQGGGSLQLTGVGNSVAAYFELVRASRVLRVRTGGAPADRWPVAA